MITVTRVFDLHSVEARALESLLLRNCETITAETRLKNVSLAVTNFIERDLSDVIGRKIPALKTVKNRYAVLTKVLNEIETNNTLRNDLSLGMRLAVEINSNGSVEKVAAVF